jgi:hypothetical protein
MKKKQNQKLAINKFQIAKIKNPQYISGGNNLDDDPPKTRPTETQEEI